MTFIKSTLTYSSYQYQALHSISILQHVESYQYYFQLHSKFHKHYFPLMEWTSLIHWTSTISLLNINTITFINTNFFHILFIITSVLSIFVFINIIHFHAITLTNIYFSRSWSIFIFFLNTLNFINNNSFYILCYNVLTDITQNYFVKFYFLQHI